MAVSMTAPPKKAWKRPSLDKTVTNLDNTLAEDAAARVSFQVIELSNVKKMGSMMS